MVMREEMLRGKKRAYIVVSRRPDIQSLLDKQRDWTIEREQCLVSRIRSTVEGNNDPLLVYKDGR
jgi:hypothetical protein